MHLPAALEATPLQLVASNPSFLLAFFRRTGGRIFLLHDVTCFFLHQPSEVPAPPTRFIEQSELRCSYLGFAEDRQGVKKKNPPSGSQFVIASFFFPCSGALVMGE